LTVATGSRQPLFVCVVPSSIMDLGVSVGPYADRLAATPDRFAFVELAIGEGELPAADVDVEALRARLDAQNLGVTVHLPYRQPIATPVATIDEATLSYLDSLLELAGALGARRAVAHPRTRGVDPTAEAVAERAAAVAAAGRAHGVPVCFETTGYAGGMALDRVGELADRADAGVCLDVGYAYLEADASGVESFLGSYADVLEHLHVHDTRHRGDTHLPLGSGDVPIDRLGTALAEAVPDVTATIEVFTDDAALLDDSGRRFQAAFGP
jgi:sugar phosphate isomerase/epimerase